jgi:hypothetical protein
VLLLLTLATSAAAQDDPRPGANPGVSSQGLDQVVYKGLVGNVLDTVPMDASQRVGLQRTNAVVSNTLLGRSLAAWAGLSNPVLLLGGLVWGIWAASNIKPAEAGMNLTADQGQTGGGAETQQRLVALLTPPTTLDDAPGKSVSAPVLVSSISAEDAEGAALSQPHVIKIWLPQRSSALPR